VLNLRDGETVTSPFNLRFGVEGYASAPPVRAPSAAALPARGHPAGRLLRTVDLANGATQANLALPNGSYGLVLRFVDGRTRRDLLPASETAVSVSAQDRV